MSDFKMMYRRDFNSQEEYDNWRYSLPDDNRFEAASKQQALDDFNSAMEYSELIPKKYNVEFDNSTNKEAYDRLDEILDNFMEWYKGDNNLLLWSRMPGTGKTVAANKFGQKFIYNWIKTILDKSLAEKERYWCSGLATLVHFINVNELLFLRKDFNNANSQLRVKLLEERIKDCNLIIWDDIGLSELSAYDKEYLTMLLDKRLNQYKKVNIYTSNLTDEQLFNAVGARLYSRIHENTEVIEFKGGDRR